ncbi:neurogenic locus Notch protein [Ditylenchus destructor]|uniref:Neurogenic locus Notch protein n=1 Tax=Ditylenchus destructor TaxID=166010 RepID=A0AAD4MZN9_9BILA|nr:neurogenic locus Notch protein [Ditylenchus destructor]
MSLISDNYTIETFNEIINAGVSSKLIYEGSICDAYPCLNDGSCVEMPNRNASKKGYFCLCPEVYTGHDCEIRVPSHCLNFTCPEGSTCWPGLHLVYPRPECISIANTTACEINPCLNGGKCLSFGGYAELATFRQRRCFCEPPFMGILCEVSFDASEPFGAHLIQTGGPNSTWSALQIAFTFSSILILVATLFALCYGCNHSCYLLLPSLSSLRQRKPRMTSSRNYTKFPFIAVNKDSECDYFFEDDLFEAESRNPGQTCVVQRGGACCIAMGIRDPSSMPISSTAESFIAYDNKEADRQSSSNQVPSPVHI